MSDRYRYTRARSVRFVKKTVGGRRLASAEGTRVKAPQAPRGVGVRGGAPAANAFLAYFRVTEGLQ